jgi:hypothetical protein
MALAKGQSAGLLLHANQAELNALQKQVSIYNPPRQTFV